MTNTGGTSSRINLNRATCLVIDDNPMALKILIQILHGFGVGNIVKSDSSKEAQKNVVRVAIDFIITDGHMPDMDGYEFVHWLRRESNCENRFVPVLMISSETQRSHVFRSRDVGANFVIAKPISPKVLLDRLFWLARDKRDFIEADTYVGPDRRFKYLGPPPGGVERRYDEQLKTPGDAGHRGPMEAKSATGAHADHIVAD